MRGPLLLLSVAIVACASERANTHAQPVARAIAAPPLEDVEGEADLENMLLALTAEAATPLPDYSEWLAYAERLDAEAPLPVPDSDGGGAPIEPCPSSDKHTTAHSFVDVNILLARKRVVGTRVLVAGHIHTFTFPGRFDNEVVIESGCRAAPATYATDMTFADSAVGCAGDGDLVVVDAKVAPRSPGWTDGAPPFSLVDAHVVAYPTASAVCSFARQHPR